MHGPARVLCAAAGLVLALASCRERPRPEAAIVTRASEIEFPATVHSARFDGSLMMPGYHLLVWRGGRARSAALLDAEVSDRSVLAALSRIARPGPSLPMDAWKRRHDSENPAPDARAEGPPIQLLLRIPGRSALIPIGAVLDDPAARGIDFRFDGNEENIPKWGSGCIVCLYSCPGGKVGNARYTERDYARSVTRYRTRPGTLPPDGTRIGVVLRVGMPESSPRTVRP